MRRFRVLFPVAGLAPGSEVGEPDLAGCNVDALVEGGFLEELVAASPPPADPPPTSGG